MELKMIVITIIDDGVRMGLAAITIETCKGGRRNNQ
jgi:hypothetical protein